VKASESILRSTLTGAAGEALVTKNVANLRSEFN